jgi:hypothetical protein
MHSEFHETTARSKEGSQNPLSERTAAFLRTATRACITTRNVDAADHALLGAVLTAP